MSATRDRECRYAYDEHARDADNQARDGRGRWLSIEGRDLVLDLGEGQALYGRKKSCSGGRKGACSQSTSQKCRWHQESESPPKKAWSGNAVVKRGRILGCRTARRWSMIRTKILTHVKTLQSSAI